VDGMKEGGEGWGKKKTKAPFARARTETGKRGKKVTIWAAQVAVLQ